MKNVNTILVIILFIMAGCGGHKQSTDEFITVDVTKSYPEKELILQDFMDVEYIALETTDEFLCRGIVKAIGKKYMIVDGYSDGEIFIYDRNGKALRKFNRKGQGSEEYMYNNEIVLDEDKGEIFVQDINKIIVYDLYGKFKRVIRFREGVQYDDVVNYDRESLICWSENRESERKPSYYITSKQDGSIIDEIEIPFEQWKSIVFFSYDTETGMIYSTVYTSIHSIINCRDYFILAEPSSDTVYKYLPDHSLIPFLVRTPSIQSMNPEVFLLPSVFTDRYFFMQIYIKKKTENPFTHLMYDRQAKTLFEYVVYNDDYTNKKPVIMRGKTKNDEIAFCQRLEAYQLVEAYEKGELKGKLKEIAAELDEDSNPVIMLVKYKK